MAGRCAQVSTKYWVVEVTILTIAVPNDQRKLRFASGAEDAERSSDILVTVMDLEKVLAAA